ncbi:MAG: hypothetical protein WDN06_13285 [Asticcacaulis sp.]
MSYITVAKAGIAARCYLLSCPVLAQAAASAAPDSASAAPVAAASPYSYDVKLTFEPDVTAKFKADGMKVILGNAFYGQANPAAVAAKKGGAGGRTGNGPGKLHRRCRRPDHPRYRQQPEDRRAGRQRRQRRQRADQRPARHDQEPGTAC